MSAVLDRHTFEDGCIFHSDRGSQYKSKAFMDFLSRQGIRQSFSRVGKLGDNPWSESFFATMKKELVHFVYTEIENCCLANCLQKRELHILFA